MSEAEIREKEANKRSLHRVNEHFEPLFDAVSASAIVLQQPANANMRNFVTLHFVSDIITHANNAPRERKLNHVRHPD
jgi:hypothetical protein